MQWAHPANVLNLQYAVACLQQHIYVADARDSEAGLVYERRVGRF